MNQSEWDRLYLGQFPEPTNRERLENCSLPHEFRLSEGVSKCLKCKGILSTVDYANYKKGILDAIAVIEKSGSVPSAVHNLRRSVS